MKPDKLYINVKGEKVLECKSAIYNLKKKDLKDFPSLYSKLLRKFGQTHSICKIRTCQVPEFWEGVERINMTSDFLNYRVSDVGVEVESEELGQRPKVPGKLLSMIIRETDDIGRYYVENYFNNSEKPLKMFVQDTIEKFNGKSLQNLLDLVISNPEVEVEYPTDLSFSLLKQQQHAMNINNIRNMLNLEICSLTVGVNVPYFYIGIHTSVSADHREDDGLASLNICHLVSDDIGENIKGCKIWVSPHPKFHQRIVDLLNTQLKLVPPCSNVLMQKKHKLSPEWFLENNIPYDVFFQEPGDIIMTFPCGIHSVTNVGLVFNEAINFGLPDWPITARTIDDCLCGRKSCVPSKLDLDKKILAKEWFKLHVKSNKTYQRECCICGKVFRNRQTFSLHKKRVHNPKSRQFPCKNCLKLFYSSYDKRRHEARCIVMKGRSSYASTS